GITLSAGDVSEAMEKLSTLAYSDALSFPELLTAQQRLVAFGASLEDVPGILGSIADGAATMGTSFDTAANAFERMMEAGTLNAKSLINLGINMQDVAAAMDLEGDS